MYVCTCMCAYVCIYTYTYLDEFTSELKSSENCWHSSWINAFWRQSVHITSLTNRYWSHRDLVIRSKVWSLKTFPWKRVTFMGMQIARISGCQNHEMTSTGKGWRIHLECFVSYILPVISAKILSLITVNPHIYMIGYQVPFGIWSIFWRDLEIQVKFVARCYLQHQTVFLTEAKSVLSYHFP